MGQPCPGEDQEEEEMMGFEDEESEMDEGTYRRLSKKVNALYAQRSKLNLHGLANFDESKPKWKSVLKRKWY